MDWLARLFETEYRFFVGSISNDRIIILCHVDLTKLFLTIIVITDYWFFLIIKVQNLITILILQGLNISLNRFIR